MNLNRAVSFAGMSVDTGGTLSLSQQSQTLQDAERRARDLRADLLTCGVHEDVLKFCKAELIDDNYFHAVLETVKSVADKLRSRTGLLDDGATLVDRAFSGSAPIPAINPPSTKNKQNEQKGFVNLLKGTFGMFRNPTAHEARINWVMSKVDAEDLLSLLSLIHRRIDSARMLNAASTGFRLVDQYNPSQ